MLGAIQRETDNEPVLLNPIPVTPPCEAYLLPVSKFPLPRPEFLRIRKFWDNLIAVASEQWGLKSHVFIQLEQLHEAPGRTLFIEKAAEWLPEVGLGVWPDRDPPAVWTLQELISMSPGKKPRPLNYQVFHITVQGKPSLQACQAMSEFGPVVQIFSRDDSMGLLSKTAAEFLPTIKDLTFRGFLYFLPLFDCKSLATSSPDRLPGWLCGSSLYIRESFEDSGILVISTRPLASLLTSSGAVLEGGGPRWRLG